LTPRKLSEAIESSMVVEVVDSDKNCQCGNIVKREKIELVD